MKLLILTGAALLWATSASAATDSGHCDSKPFTLKKPVAVAVTKPAPAPKPAPPKPASTKIAKTNKYVPGCKQPKG